MTRIIWIMLIALLLAGCQGGTSYSASCNNRTADNTSTCTITFTSLAGQFSRDVPVNLVVAEGQAEIPIKLTMTVEKGQVLVSFAVPSGQVLVDEANPDAPLTLSDVARIDGDHVTVNAWVLEGTATGVEINVELGE